jgi:hypothetical protein
VANDQIFPNSTGFHNRVYGLSKPAKFRRFRSTCSLQQQQPRQKSNTSPKTLDRDRVQPRQDHEIRQIRGGDISSQALGRFDSADGATKRSAEPQMYPDPPQINPKITPNARARSIIAAQPATMSAAACGYSELRHWWRSLAKP